MPCKAVRCPRVSLCASHKSRRPLTFTAMQYCYSNAPYFVRGNSKRAVRVVTFRARVTALMTAAPTDAPLQADVSSDRIELHERFITALERHGHSSESWSSISSDLGCSVEAAQRHAFLYLAALTDASRNDDLRDEAQPVNGQPHRDWTDDEATLFESLLLLRHPRGTVSETDWLEYIASWIPSRSCEEVTERYMAICRERHLQQ